jgi:integrase
LAGKRAREIRNAEGGLGSQSTPAPRQLGEYAEHHLNQKLLSGRVTEAHVEATETYLSRAVDFFGGDCTLSGISVAAVGEYCNHLRSTVGRHGRTLSDGTVRKHLNALSHLYRRAIGEGSVAIGLNPVSFMLDKPVDSEVEARWLEVDEAARFLEGAIAVARSKHKNANPLIDQIVASFLLTGGRQSEVLGLTNSDVNFDRRTITFRPNHLRRLKTPSSQRVVPLWPQLEEVLSVRRDKITNGDPLGPLFPSKRGAKRRVTDIRKALDLIAVGKGWAKGEIRTRIFRHTYCAARLQTLDAGKPISTYTVSRELGHRSLAMVETVYGHLGEIRQRSEVVEYRSELLP